MIFDAHSDIWTDVTVKISKGENNIIKKYHYDNLIKGKIGGSIFVIWTEPKNYNRALERVREIQDAIKKELEYIDDVILIAKSYDDIIKAQKENKLYIFIGFEGLISIDDNINLLDEYYEFGARHASLTWNEENKLATGARGDSNRGLTSLGKKAVKKMQEKGMIVDVSHLNDKSFFDIMDITSAPIIASHSNARALCNSMRNLTDEQLKAIRDVNGVIGYNSYKDFTDEDTDKQTLNRAVDHIKYIADKIGIDHIGLGFDYNEYFEDEEVPPAVKGLENASKSYDIIIKLKEAGFNDEEIEKIEYKNFHRIIKEIIK
ncbi:membrane dipeptidase [Brachyspira intermedia PWS/A]|uniref:Membrane dipeptidase n=1 Tax=Brachyspira intermedia (strain ATCC 51140 / PWS/A) TaxID=1045858 RepID=G0EKF3_BRAIP|nr:membrane dipeptidase [Brachyspira intermedia]AEM21341.1 membrane dipeptidase [Brachyspira intermedia PWS/A]